MSWLLRLDELQEREIVEAVQDSGTSSTSYLLLLLLSTVIASFGLLANSTATVIGAMIVAPLMGPILGLGLGLVRGDVRLVRRALLAEVVGVLLVLGTSAGLALLVGVENIDFQASEIVGRTRPTLFDLAIGLAAGMAGAYATVNPRISGSIAGVAIAVALVPPLSVSGLLLAGATRHGHLGSQAFEAFMLFLANFLTIELAAVLVFLVVGLGHLERLFRVRTLSTALMVNLVLLVGTAGFLYAQLHTLVLERNLRERTRDYLSSRVPALIPGATVADLVVTLNPGVLKVRVAVRASQEITPSMAAEMARDLRRRLDLQDRVSLDLVVGTGLFAYVSPTGRLYAREAEPDPAQILNQRVDLAFRRALQAYPRAELVEWQRSDIAAPSQVVLTVRSPYVFDAWLVGELQGRVNQELRELDPGAPPLALTVRTTLGQDFTAEGSVQTPLADLRSQPERDRLALEQRVRQRMEELVPQAPQAWLVSLELSVPAPPPSERPSPEVSASPSPSEVPPGEVPASLPIEVSATVRSPRLLPRHQVRKWEEVLEVELERPVRLTVENLLGEVLDAGNGVPAAHPSPAPPASVPPRFPDPSRQGKTGGKGILIP